ncbi:PAM68 family protein [Leptothoe sp. PORK10 BA2]|uniref:PAM68 family protein n=1 Tax=Leptothoe sp. PORK10 BA2 TaxID=3110254 RepID=UPI002B21BAC4|nr:PAM68 family protein [Leptothoe sp. PORK10 BA2]MEA5463489.1 PAM68 family protein [Leptothoe sp. PORK10 BA2]
MPSESQREPLPFEPKSSKQSSGKATSSNDKPLPKSSPRSPGKTSPRKESAAGSERVSKVDAGIPEVVSRRMMRRMAVFSGVPTFLGMSSFVVAYILLTRHIVEFPNVVVLLVSLGFFGLGVMGLTYGVLSSSWEEEEAGSLLGWSEFSVNFRRMVQGLRKKPSASE